MNFGRIQTCRDSSSLFSCGLTLQTSAPESTVYKEKLQIYVHNLGRQLGSEEGCKQGP